MMESVWSHIQWDGSRYLSQLVDEVMRLCVEQKQHGLQVEVHHSSLLETLERCDGKVGIARMAQTTAFVLHWLCHHPLSPHAVEHAQDCWRQRHLGHTLVKECRRTHCCGSKRETVDDLVDGERLVH